MGSSEAREEEAVFLSAQLSPETVKAWEFDLIGMLNLLQAKATAMCRAGFCHVTVLQALSSK